MPVRHDAAPPPPAGSRPAGKLRRVFARLLACVLLACAHDAVARTGGYTWRPEIAPAGPVVVVISLDEQRAYVYRNGIGIGVSPISSGKPGYETPPGVYTILEKKVIEFSNLYDNAPMPFMQRLTWSGIALHGGTLPGFPASHGCIRLPQPFAEKLFGITQAGTTVVVAEGNSAPYTVAHPALLAPVTAAGMALEPAEGDYYWNDAAPPGGPLSLLLSTSDRTLFVFRNGAMIGRAKLKDVPSVSGTVLYVMRAGIERAPSPLDPSRPRHRWNAYPIAAHAAPHPRVDDTQSLRVPSEFARRLYGILVPGTTALVTDAAAINVPVDAGPAPVLESRN